MVVLGAFFIVTEKLKFNSIRIFALLFLIKTIVIVVLING